MIIIITPFIADKSRCRLVNLKEDHANAEVNLAEPWWYANDHFNVLCLMYGGSAPKRPDILGLRDLPAIERWLDRTYRDFELVHVPADIHVNVAALHDLVASGRYRTLPTQASRETSGRLEQPFVRDAAGYYPLPVSVVDARNPGPNPGPDAAVAPLIRFDASNGVEEINDWLARCEDARQVIDDRATAMPIGAWCGTAEALRVLGLRREAYPFDYVRTELSLITELLDSEPLSTERVCSLLFEEGPDARVEFVHHQKDDEATRNTFVDRTLRFFDHIKASERPILFVRATHENPDLGNEVQQCREWLAAVDRRRPGRQDRLVLIANFHHVLTGKIATFDGGRIALWNGMGVNGWHVPNRWLVFSQIAKIIASELHHFESGSPVNYALGFDHIEAQIKRHSSPRISR